MRRVPLTYHHIAVMCLQSQLSSWTIHGTLVQHLELFSPKFSFKIVQKLITTAKEKAILPKFCDSIISSILAYCFAQKREKCKVAAHILVRRLFFYLWIPALISIIVQSFRDIIRDANTDGVFSHLAITRKMLFENWSGRVHLVVDEFLWHFTSDLQNYFARCWRDICSSNLNYLDRAS